MAAQFGRDTLQSKFVRTHDAITDAFRNGQLHAHQVEALDALRAFFEQPNNEVALIVLPTGAGKSGVAVLAPYILNVNRVLVITPSATITRQLEQDFCGGTNEADQFVPPFLAQCGVATVDDMKFYVEPAFAAVTQRDGGSSLAAKMRSFSLVICNAHKLSPIHTDRIQLADIPQSFDLVIVDEAHHYPADTWKQIVDHFQHSRKLFLTATPFHQGERIRINDIELPICYQKSKDELIQAGVIRPTHFIEVPSGTTDTQIYYKEVIIEIIRILEEHDLQDPTTTHQAMVLTRKKEEADLFVAYAQELQLPAAAFHQESPSLNLNNFMNGKLRVLAVCGKLLEGFDKKSVSVAVILRNVAPESRVLFTQFVGRAVRKMNRDDPITATVISHACHDQFDNYNAYCDPQLAEVDPDHV